MSDETPPGMMSVRSVAGRASLVPMGEGSGWRNGFCLALLISSLIKLWLAAHLAPFVDEAFYWQESRQLAWSYSDVPGLTAWLIGLGETLFGHSALAMRAPFLLLGALIPCLMVVMVRRFASARAGWQAGLWTLALPLLGSLGVLALPDVPLTFASMLALLALERAAAQDRLRYWCLLGVALALAWLSHYRAAILIFSGLAFLLFSARGRSLWSRPGLWWALAISSLGLLPLWLFNLQHDWAGLGFQMRDRHPWRFHADALLQPLEQAVVVTPLLYGLLLLVLWMALRRLRRGAPWDVMALSAVVPLLGYFVVGLFADGERFRVHWPLPGYLPLIALLPVLAAERAADGQRLWRVAQPFAAVVAALAGAVILAWLLVASQPSLAARWSGSKLFPAPFVGWNEAGALLREARMQTLATDWLVADNFILAAQLDFTLGGEQPVYVLDSPLNAKHGRAAQLALWSRDETALRAHVGQRVLLIVDETALRERQRQAWLQSLCSRISDLVPISRLDLYAGRKRIALYAGRVAAPESAGIGCDYPPQAGAITE